jgi:hypothetical protein
MIAVTLLFLARLATIRSLAVLPRDASPRSYWPPLHGPQTMTYTAPPPPLPPPSPTEAVLASVKDAFLTAPTKSYWPPAASFAASTFGNSYWPPPKSYASPNSAWLPTRPALATDEPWVQDAAVVACVAAALASTSYWPPSAAGPQRPPAAGVGRAAVPTAAAVPKAWLPPVASAPVAASGTSGTAQGHWPPPPSPFLAVEKVRDDVIPASLAVGAQSELLLVEVQYKIYPCDALCLFLSLHSFIRTHNTRGHFKLRARCVLFPPGTTR